MKGPSRPRVLICPTAFKGTLTPHQSTEILARVFRQHSRAVTECPLADGGDGTLDVLLAAWGGHRVKTRVTGPLGSTVTAEWGRQGKKAVVEMARASGLALTNGRNKIMKATTRGVGQLIEAVLDAGCDTLWMGVGGTATAEGGAGALEEVGLRYWDAKGRRLSADPLSLLRLHRVDWTGLDRRVPRLKINVLCDVKNPLLGAHGSARTYGPQKGATPEQVRQLEHGLTRWSRFALFPVANAPGAGAAGATAFGLAGFLGATLVPGAPSILAATQWEAKASRADLLVTGEGRLDDTSFQGKVPGLLARLKKRSRLIVVCGSTSLSPRQWKQKGVDHVEVLGADGARAPARALRQAAERLAPFCQGD